MVTGEETIVQSVDVEDLLESGEPVLFAVDQLPFEVESRGVKYTFCLLAPLMTDRGAEIEGEQFHNRERVWWMLRGDIDPDPIQVGMVWCAPIERSREFGNPEPEKDHYQVRRGDIEAGSRHHVEVLNLTVADPNLVELLHPSGIPWPYAPLDRVVFRAGRTVVGPFRTKYDGRTGRVRLRATSDTSPVVYRLPRSAFESEVEIREYSYTANRWDAKTNETRVEIGLVHERDLSILERDGKREDGATDEQIISWAFESLSIAESERERLADLYHQASEILVRADLDRFPGRLDRFLALAADRHRIVELGQDVAEALSRGEGFRDLVEQHVERIAAERIEEEVARRNSEIDRRTTEAASQLEELETVLGERKEEYERLDGVADRIRDGSKEIRDIILSQWPVLERLGIVGSSLRGGHLHNASPHTRSRDKAAHRIAEITAPERPRGHVDEETFLSQLETVAASSGYVFSSDDLINFHTLMKTELFIALVGPHGSGRTALPRLYADALGSSDEFLDVSVRSSWRDESDLLGSFDRHRGIYEPAPTGIVDHFISAQIDLREKRGALFISCFEEMNLARVEHYFAPLINALDRPIESRVLRLVADGILDPADPYAAYHNVTLGPNLRFVGTLDVDGSTYALSPRIIDRLAIDSLARPDLARRASASARQSLASLKPVHREDYESWTKPVDEGGHVLEILLRIDDVLSPLSAGLSLRVRDRALRYVASARHWLSEDKAIDFALLQNVLPRLSPSMAGYEAAIHGLRKILPPARFRHTTSRLETLEGSPDYTFFELA